MPTAVTSANLLGKGRFNETAVEKILQSALENVTAFAQMGGLIALGTDAGAWEVPHACDTEQTLLHQAGVDENMLTRGGDVIQAKF